MGGANRSPESTQVTIYGAVVVLSSAGPDKVLLQTKLPGAGWPPTDPLTLSFEAGRGTGADYVKKAFGFDPVIVGSHDVRR